jgi:hypothetical protein
MLRPSSGWAIQKLPNMRMDLSIALVLKEVVCSLAGHIQDRLSCE